jgi:outer membrane protein insertion porin family
MLCVGSAAGLVPPGVRGQESASRIDRVEIEGNVRVDQEAIRVHLRSVSGAAFDKAEVSRDIRAVYQMGFFERVQADWRDEDGEHVLVFQVVERPLIRDLRIDGAKKVKPEEIEAALKVRRHTILDPARIREGLAAAKQLYEEEGYLDAVIEERTVDLGNNEVELVYTVDERKLIRINKIRFEGNEEFSDRKLRRALATKQKWFLSRFTGSGLLKTDVLNADIERISALYYDRGYITVRVDEPDVEREGDHLVVTFQIEEGDQFRVGELSIAGAEDFVVDLQAILDDLALKPGEVFSAGALRRDVEAVTDVFADEGFAFASVEPGTRVREAERLVDIQFTGTRGPQVYVDRIEVMGNVKTRDKVVRRELRLHEQDLFSATKLRKSRENLQRLGFFGSVNIKTRRTTAPDKLDVIVEVSEAQTGSFSAGAGFSSADQLLFNVRISEVNLFGRGQRLTLNADFGSLRRNFILSFTEPYLFDTRLTGTFDAFSWQLVFDKFTREGTGFGMSFLYPMDALGIDRVGRLSLEDVRAGLGYRFEQAEINDLSSDAARSIRQEKGTSLISSVTPRLRRSTLNHAFDPTGGSLQDLSIQLAGLGGDTTFVKADLQSRWFYSFWESPRFGTFTYSIGGKLGLGYGEEGESGNELPLFERYFPGGLNSVRGYKVRTLGPREKQRNTLGTIEERQEIGGSQQLEFSNEIIFPILQGLGVKGVVFFDAGQAFTADDGINITKLRYAFGGGLRWLSPFGPLRVELGIPINPREGDDKTVILFSFGGPLQ